MAITNIHRSSQLVQRAGSNVEDQAYIEPFHKPVYIICAAAEAMQLQRIAGLMSSENLRNEQWMFVDPQRTDRPKNGPTPLPVPQLFISPALRASRSSTTSIVQNLRYLAVIQDLTGGERLKFIMRSNVESLASSMMHEVMNGYSIVLTGALLHSAEISIAVDWVKVDSVDDLQRIADEPTNVFRPRMGFFC